MLQRIGQKNRQTGDPAWERDQPSDIEIVAFDAIHGHRFMKRIQLIMKCFFDAVQPEQRTSSQTRRTSLFGHRFRVRKLTSGNNYGASGIKFSVAVSLISNCIIFC